VSEDAPKSMTAAKAAEIISGWCQGKKYEEACVQAGLTPAEARLLKKDGDWMQAWEQARAAFVAGSLDSIRSHGEKDWKASAWLLERIMPERFGKRDVLDVNVKIGPLPWTSIVSGEVIAADAEVRDAKDDDGEEG
jgi:hypothetical protein